MRFSAFSRLPEMRESPIEIEDPSRIAPLAWLNWRKFADFADRYRRGAAAVEFAVVAPVFFLMIFGMIEFGRMIMVQQVLTNASREGARLAVLDGTASSDVKTAVAKYLTGARIYDNVTTALSSATIRVYVGVGDTYVLAEPSTAGYGAPVTVTVEVPFSQVSWLPSPIFVSENAYGDNRYAPGDGPVTVNRGFPDARQIIGLARAGPGLRPGGLLGITQVMAKRGDGKTPAAETRTVCVAAKDVAMGESLTRETVSTEEWPKDKVPTGTVTSLDDAEGRRAETKFFAGEPILDQKLFGKGESSGADALIPKGYRVVSVRVDAVSGGGGLLLPGSRVDLLVHMTRNPSLGMQETITRTILQDIKVFAVNDVVSLDSTGQQDTKSIQARTVSLLVTPAQAEKITLASELGTIRLVMRSPDEDSQAQTRRRFAARTVRHVRRLAPREGNAPAARSRRAGQGQGNRRLRRFPEEHAREDGGREVRRRLRGLAVAQRARAMVHADAQGRRRRRRRPGRLRPVVGRGYRLGLLEDQRTGGRDEPEAASRRPPEARAAKTDRDESAAKKDEFKPALPKTKEKKPAGDAGSASASLKALPPRTN